MLARLFAGQFAFAKGGSVSRSPASSAHTRISSTASRAVSCGPVICLLDFGRASETVDLSSLALTHYTLKNLGTRRLALDSGEGEYKLKPSGPGCGEVRDKQKAALEEIIARVNKRFVGELTAGSKLLYGTARSRASCWSARR